MTNALNPFANIPPEILRERIEDIARAMSPLSFVMGEPVFPLEMVTDMGRALRTSLPADVLVRELVSNKTLGERIINTLLSHGKIPHELWLQYNVWRSLDGKEPL